MRNVMQIVLVVVLLLCLSSCTSTSAWIWGDDGAVGARVGTNVTENNEAGLSMLWWPEDVDPEVMGLYAIHHFPVPVEFRNPLIVDFLPEILEGRAYLGGKLDVDFGTDETTVGPIAGVIFENTLFFETSLDKPVLFGLRFKF